MTTREPPHNVEAEQAVLACMLLEQSAVVKATALLETEDFYRETHKLIFDAMEALADRGEDINYVAVNAILSDRQQLEAVGGIGYVLSLANALPTSANVEQLAKIVKGEAVKRKLLDYARRVVAGLVSGEDVTAQLEKAFSGLNSIMHEQINSGFEAMPTMLARYIEEISKKSLEEGQYSGLPTSFQALDELTSGLQKSDFIILAARPSMGKTAMVMNMIANIIANEKEEGCVVGLFSMEMSKSQLMNRLISLQTGIDSQRIHRNELEEEEWMLIWQSVERLGHQRLYVDDTGGLTVGALRNRARRMQAEHGLDILFIDYVQLMSNTNGTMDRQQAIAEISRQLKALARELEIPIVALSQLSRAVEGRTEKRPLLSDLRESGSLEQDADIVMFLYRDDYYNHEASQMPGVTELIIAKHRNGPTGTLRFYFEKKCMRFVEMV